MQPKHEMLLRRVLGELAERTRGDRLHKDVVQRIQKAHLDALEPELAALLGMHASDWVGEAAFLVALHLFPAEFTDDEVRDGVAALLDGAAEHVRAARQILGRPDVDRRPDGAHDA